MSDQSVPSFQKKPFGDAANHPNTECTGRGVSVGLNPIATLGNGEQITP